MRRLPAFICLLLLFTQPVYQSHVFDSEEVETDQIRDDLGFEKSGRWANEAAFQAFNFIGDEDSQSSPRRGTQGKFQPSEKLSATSKKDMHEERPVIGKKSCTGKKGQGRKSCGKSNAIVYRPRSSLTDEFNQVIDGMLLQLSQTVVNVSKKNAFHTRVAFIPMNLRVLSWAYVLLRNDNQTVKAKNAVNALRSEPKGSSVSNQELAVNSEDMTNRMVDDVYFDEIDNEAGVKQSALEEAHVIVQKSLEAVTRNDRNDQESKTLDIDLQIGGGEGSDDNPRYAEESKLESNRLVYTSFDSAVEGTGAETSEMSLQVHQPDHKATTGQDAERPSSAHKGAERVRSKSRKGRKRDGYSSKRMRKRMQRTKGRFSLHLPRRTNAVVAGLEKIQRMDDVMIATKDESITVIETTVQVGPIEIAMKGTAEPVLRKTKASTPPLLAILRSQQRNGKFINILFKPVKIQPNAALAAIRRGTGQDLPSKHQSARVVIHLSREVSRLWNSGFFLRRMGRSLKQAYKHDQAFLALVKKHESEFS